MSMLYLMAFLVLFDVSNSSKVRTSNGEKSEKINNH